MADDSQDRFEAAVSVMQRHFKEEDFDGALSACNHACELRPESAPALRCKIFALLNLSKWSDALQACEKWATGEKKAAGAEGQFDFETAYCYYRLNRFQDGLAALKSCKGPAAVRLEAQLRYRTGDYEKSSQIYEKLWQEEVSKKGDEDVGLLVNAVASAVSGERPTKALTLTNERQDLLETSYELLFNLSSALIDLDRLTEAEARLEEATEVCKKDLEEAEEDGEEDEEPQNLDDSPELAAIHVQKGCVLQRKGAIDGANALYNKVLKQNPGQDNEVDVTVLAVACNNVVTLRSEGKSLFDSLKRINVASKESLEHKLTRKQHIEIAMNKCLLLLQARRVEEARREAEKLAESFPGHPRVAILKATIAYSDKKTKAGAEEILKGYLAEHKLNDEVTVTLAQLYTQQGRVEQALEVLTSLPVERRSHPQILEVMSALFQKQKQEHKAVEILKDAIKHWTNTKDTDEEELAHFLKTASRLAKMLRAEDLAAEVYESYLKQVDGSDLEALCECVKALSATDVARADEYVSRLRVPDYSHLDPEDLENAPIPKMIFTTPKKKDAKKDDADATTAAEESEAALAENKEKRKKKRKPRYPKNFDPENPGRAPDPERWLPKHERAEFKKRLRKKDKGLARGPQGSMAEDTTKKGPSSAQVEVAKDKVPPRTNKKRGKK